MAPSVTPIYLIGGLGADERAFAQLDWGGRPTVFVPWVAPQPADDLRCYAQRMLAQIPSVKPTLVGLSFGGMLAVEMGQLADCEQVIVLATAKTWAELPWYIRLAGALRLAHWVPTRWLLRPNPLVYWLFGAGDPGTRQLLAGILRHTDPPLLGWALRQIPRWRNRTLPPRLRHLHGTADRILPHRYVTCQATIAGGGHLFTCTHAAQVSAVLRGWLREGGG
ncbi:MAG: alpha/beta hydrolase [Bernardetiaceae bacterium]|jgi:pimeloyl-ACP methyl ester carboxylesterase|nr:alpha/beta hydrolase [Bernardetiaceae bacterium]